MTYARFSLALLAIALAWSAVTMSRSSGFLGLVEAVPAALLVSAGPLAYAWFASRRRENYRYTGPVVASIVIMALLSAGVNFR